MVVGQLNHQRVHARRSWHNTWEKSWPRCEEMGHMKGNNAQEGKTTEVKQGGIEKGHRGGVLACIVQRAIDLSMRKSIRKSIRES